MASNDPGAAPLHVVILCHPDDNSFNASVARAYCDAVEKHGHRAILRDLYAMNFNPVLRREERPGPAFRRFPDVTDELAILADAVAFVLVYPIWFGTPPAMMKGYVERVLASAATAQDVQAAAAKGVLTGKVMISFTSSAAREVWLNLQGQVNGLRSCFDHYIKHAFALRMVRHVHYDEIVDGVDAGFVRQYLSDVRMEAGKVIRELADASARAAAG
ncbi:NAD(P)H-dependent oxidoreductase [Sphingomonas sp. NFR15]|uniref:NAD(P)H-dependent oxidoreductase n=1 Tax=Sphingomonas sp. NFR15 TaxID=1566282 RepID=UPI00088B1665|nr:NAD(P)H-dependent oxidoreductase [Sphingomonas sp. NFR15]SDA16512.1 NAD(P)H dehydrogenase (quinone) [Sphingomonas sp. NFR15]